MPGKQEQGKGGLLGDHAVAEEPEEVHTDLPSAASTSHRQPINHATNAGLRESRGEFGESGEDFPPGVGVVGARRPERQTSTACSFNGRLFLSAVSWEASALFQSRVWAVAHKGRRTATSVSVSDLYGPSLDASDAPLAFESMAVAVGQRLRVTSQASPASTLPWVTPWLGAFVVVRFSFMLARGVGQSLSVTFGASESSESSESRTGPTRPCPPPRLFPARCAVAVGQKEDAGP